MDALKIVDSILKTIAELNDITIVMVFGAFGLLVVYLIVKAIISFFSQNKLDEKLGDVTKAIGRCEAVIDSNTQLLRRFLEP